MSGCFGKYTDRVLAKEKLKYLFLAEEVESRIVSKIILGAKTYDKLKDVIVFSSGDVDTAPRGVDVKLMRTENGGCLVDVVPTRDIFIGGLWGAKFYIRPGFGGSEVLIESTKTTEARWED